MRTNEKTDIGMNIEVRMLNNCGDDAERLKPHISNWVEWNGDLLRSGSI